MKAVLMSIRPEWCAKIASGHKTVEIRKTIPKLPTPFKVYVYCTDPDTVDPHKYLETHYNGKIYKCNGKVFAEFVCDRIRPEPEVADGLIDLCLSMTSCVEPADILKYANGKTVYSWHISNLVIYDKPKELGEFTRLRETKFGYEPVKIKRPPQSWCYVEGAIK